MTQPGPQRPFAHLALVVACAAVLTVVLYRMTVGYGFFYDDYHFVHPYSAAEVGAAFHGRWDATGIETAYYRPLTICLYAARFYLFGLNSAACHVLSLVMFAGAAAAFAVFAMRTADSTLAGLLAAAAIAVHPGMPYSAVAWITNQMHLAELLVVAAACTWWFRVRRRSLVWWLPLLALQVAALLIKEDGVMLVPAIVALHTLRKWLVEPELPHVPPLFVVAGLAAIGVLLAVRQSALEGAAHTRLPSFEQARNNLWGGLRGTYTLVPARRPYQWSASWFVILTPLAAFAVWPRVPRPTRFVMLAGLAISVLFICPFVFIIKAEQMHIVALGAALFLAGAATAVIQACGSHTAWRALTGVTCIAALMTLAAVAMNIARDFAPFAPNVLRTDVDVEGWAAVPVELREFLHAKRTADRTTFESNPARALDIVGFGMHGIEIDPTGRPLRWMSQPAAQFYVRRDKRLLSIPVRHEIGAFREPARVRVTTDGRLIEELTLADGNWHTINVALKPRDAARFTGMHLLLVELPHCWIPAEVIPGSGDRRTLGLQIGKIEVR